MIHRIAAFSTTLFLFALFACAQSAQAAPNAWSGEGPFGGRVDRIVVDPTATARMYASGSGAGFFFSQSAGGNWQPVNINAPGFNAEDVLDFWSDPQRGGVLYAVDDTAVVAKSTNYGVDWTLNSAGLNHPVRALQGAPSAPDTIFAYSFFNLSRSDDAGLTWTQIDNGLDAVQIFEVQANPQNPDILFVAGRGALQRSLDGGATWTRLTNGLTPDAQGNYNARALAIDPDNPDRMFVAMGSQVFKSVDGGTSFAPTSVLSISSLNALALDPNDTSRLFVGATSGLRITEDEGVTYIGPSSGIFGYHIEHVYFDPVIPNRVHIGSLGKGIFRSINGGTQWFTTNIGYDNERITAVSISPNDDTVYAGTSAGAQRSLDDGLSWSQSTGSYDLTTLSVAANPTTPGHAYIGSSCCGLYESTDFGSNYNRVTLNGGALVPLQVSAIDMPIADGQRILISDRLRGLFGSSDGAATWADLGTGLAPFFGGAARLSSVDAMATDANVVYVSSDQTIGGGVYRSNDAGMSWIRTSGPGIGEPNIVYEVAAHPTDPDIAFAAGLDLYRTDDGGINWTRVDEASGGILRDILVDESRPGLIYALTSQSDLFRSLDGGLTWDEPLTPPDSVLPLATSLANDPQRPSRVLVGYALRGIREYTFATDLIVSAATVNPSPAVGDMIDVDVAVTVSDPTDAHFVEFNIDLPANFVLINVSSSQGACTVGAVVSCNLGTIAVGNFAIATVTLQATGSGPVVFEATAAALEEDFAPADNVFALTLSPGATPDSDGDGVNDTLDNCTLTPNAGQQDGDADGYGNACDADFDQSCLVNVVDLGIFRAAFFTADATADLNSDGIVNVSDLGLFRILFFGAPGPSGVADVCGS